MAAPPPTKNIQLKLEVPASSNVGDKLQITTGFGAFNFVVPQGAALDSALELAARMLPNGPVALPGISRGANATA